jgi:hypothetical protein
MAHTSSLFIFSSSIAVCSAWAQNNVPMLLGYGIGGSQAEACSYNYLIAWVGTPVVPTRHLLGYGIGGSQAEACSHDYLID